MDIGSKIAKLRSSKGWSQNQLADQLGVSEGTVRDWESGNSIPAAAKVDAIAPALGVEPEYLSPENTPSQSGARDSVPMQNNANVYGGYRVARDEMRVQRDQMRMNSGRGSALYSIYWVVVVLVYLAVSYYFHVWSWSWIILIIAAAIFYPIMNSQKN